MEKLSDAVVFILLDKKSSKVLLEKRPATEEYIEADIFPAGKVENKDGVADWVKDNNLTLCNALIREIGEELGVAPRWFHQLPQPEIIFSPLGRIMYPFIVTDWGDKDLPDYILDNGHPIFWEDLDNVLDSPIPSVRKIAEDVKSFLQE